MPTTIPLGLGSGPLAGGAGRGLRAARRREHEGQSQRGVAGLLRPDANSRWWEGRDFTRADNAKSPRVTIVNQTFVRQFLHRPECDRPEGHGRGHLVHDHRGGEGQQVHQRDGGPLPYLYLAFLQCYDPGDEFTVLHPHRRAPRGTRSPLCGARRSRWTRRVAIFNTMPLADHIEGSLLPPESGGEPAERVGRAGAAAGGGGPLLP